MNINRVEKVTLSSLKDVPFGVPFILKSDPQGPIFIKVSLPYVYTVLIGESKKINTNSVDCVIVDIKTGELGWDHGNLEVVLLNMIVQEQ